LRVFVPLFEVRRVRRTITAPPWSPWSVESSRRWFS